MSSVPPVILLCILESTFYHPLVPDYKLLRVCTLVCRAWTGPAQFLLFKFSKIKLHNNNIHTFHAALLASAALGRALVDRVRVLYLTISRSIESEDSEQLNRELGLPADTASCKRSFLTLAKLLQACPQLTVLHLVIVSIVHLDQDVIEELKAAGLGVRALNLVNYGAPSYILFYVLSVWPNIRFLNISGNFLMPSCPTASPAPQEDADNTGDFKLAQRNGVQIEVSLYHLILSSDINPEVLTWLLASSVDSLRILDRPTRYRPPQNILARHAPRLRSLSLPFCDDDISLIRMCTALEKLVFYNFDLPPRYALAPNLPPTIEHFTFAILDFNHGMTLKPIIDAVDALPNLKVLACNEFVWQQRPHEYMELARMCKNRGVNMVDLPLLCAHFIVKLLLCTDENRRNIHSW